jgi:hypothetical protein
MPQVPLLQLGVPPLLEQTVAQLPQWPESFLRSASQPLVTSPSQLAYPVRHVIPQAPAAHVAVPCAVLQVFTQVPQCNGSVLRLDSHPVPALPSQSPKPPPQVIPHTPATQVAVPLVALHAFPQALQLAGLIFRSISQPLATLPSQLP